MFTNKTSIYTNKTIDDIFDEHHFPLIKTIDHRALIQEWKNNLDAAPYEKT